MAGPNQIRTDARDRARDQFGKPGVQIATPNVDDLVIVETLDKVKGQKWRAPYGTPHSEFPAATLIKQTRTAGDKTDYVATYVYATPRVNQDAYNAAITYTAQSGAHRIFSRSSLVRRDADPTSGTLAYAPILPLTPDSADPTALCTQEQAAPAEAPYDTLYLRVTRIFENFGTRLEQDAWNRQDSLPYLLATYPRLTRVYRFPATYDPGFVIGTTADSEVPAAKLISAARSDESSRVRVYTCIFDAIPSADVQAGVGSPATGIPALGVSIGYPYGAKEYPQVSWTFRVGKGDYTPAADDNFCPIPGYTTLRLTGQSEVPDPDSPAVAIVTRVYDVIPGPALTTEEKIKTPRTLTPIPPEFLNGDDLTVTTQVVAPGTPVPNLSNTVLSAKVAPDGLLKSNLETISRPDVAYPELMNYTFVDGADRALGVVHRTIITPEQAFTRAFGTWDVSDTPLSPTQSVRNTTTVASFPILSGYSTGAVGDHFPGEFGISGGQGAETYREEIVATGTTPSLLTGEALLSRTPIDQCHDRVRVGSRSGGSGVTLLEGTELGRFGTITREWQLGLSTATTGQNVLSSEASPAGDGQMKLVTAISADSATPAGRQYRGWEGIEGRFLAALQVVTTETPVTSDALPDVSAGVIKSTTAPTDNPARYIKTTESLSGITALAQLPTLTGSEIGRDADGGNVAETEQYLAAGTAFPAITFKILGLKDTPVGNGIILRTQRQLTDSVFPILHDYDVVDQRYGVRLHEQHQIIAASGAVDPGAPSGGVTISYKTIDQYRAIKLTRTLLVPSSIPDEYGQAGWHRPGILKAITNISTNPNKPKLLITQDNARAYIGQTKTSTWIAAGLMQDAPTAPILGGNIDYNGQSINLHLNDILYNGGVTITDQGDPVTIPPTSVTASAYTAMIGMPILIASKVRPYELGGGLQIKQNVYLYIQ